MAVLKYKRLQLCRIALYWEGANCLIWGVCQTLDFATSTSEYMEPMAYVFNTNRDYEWSHLWVNSKWDPGTNPTVISANLEERS